jgi:hypothetical protein
MWLAIAKPMGSGTRPSEDLLELLRVAKGPFPLMSFDPGEDEVMVISQWYPGSGGRRMISTIVVGTDGSNHGQHAVIWTAELAR